ncbi:BlaI/MecI/CopY family transcriptional regulator [Clostridioides difficile]|nr:BlaI/MecI/CopY family transcriptional regulator [Clostridioides difficile]
MYFRKISRSEIIVMKFIWNSDIKVKSCEVINHMKEKYDYSEKTTLKILSKLAKKNFLYIQETDKCTYYTAAIKEEKYHDFISKNLNSLSIKSLILLFCEDKLSEEKINSLEEWVKNWEDDEK